MNTYEIGHTIKKTRKTLGLTQNELASVADVGVRTLSEIENGKETAQIGLVFKVLFALGIVLRLDAQSAASPPVGKDKKS